MTAPLPLSVQLALTLAGLCVCRHLEHAHDEHGCRFCACAHYERTRANDAIAREVLHGNA